MTIPSHSYLTPVPEIYDEGYAETRQCRIHIGAPMHVHLAVCPVCRSPLTAEQKNAFCVCYFEEPSFQCMYDADAERSVLSTSEILENEPWRGQHHTPVQCCDCPGLDTNGNVVHGPLRGGKKWIGYPGEGCYPPRLDDPTRLSGCACDQATNDAV